MVRLLDIIKRGNKMDKTEIGFWVLVVMIVVVGMYVSFTLAMQRQPKYIESWECTEWISSGYDTTITKEEIVALCSIFWNIPNASCYVDFEEDIAEMDVWNDTNENGEFCYVHAGDLSGDCECNMGEQQFCRISFTNCTEWVKVRRK